MGWVLQGTSNVGGRIDCFSCHGLFWGLFITVMFVISVLCLLIQYMEVETPETRGFIVLVKQ